MVISPSNAVEGVVLITQNVKLSTAGLSIPINIPVNSVILYLIIYKKQKNQGPVHLAQSTYKRNAIRDLLNFYIVFHYFTQGCRFKFLTVRPVRVVIVI